MLHPTNQVALVCSHSSGCTSLYPDDKQGNDSVLRQQDGQYEVFYHMETVIKEKVAQVMEKDKGPTNYYMFKLKNKEFTFDVDNSQLPCGLNGALYFVEMQKDGGLGAFPGNKVGAAFGTGYCDAQCPHDVKYINGEPNSQDWIPSETDANA